MLKPNRPTQLPPQVRTVTFRLQPHGEQRDGTIDIEARTAEVAFASETPCDMWYGTEILSLAPGAMRSGVRQQTMPLLFNHDADDLLGVVDGIEVGTDRIARARVRFGRDERGDWAMRQAADGVLVNVSFMYRVFKWQEDVEEETLTALDWEPFEISLVTVPADPTVGVGRQAGAETPNGVQLVRKSSAAATTASPTQTTLPQAAAQPQEPVMPHRMLRQRLQEQADPNTTTAGGAVAAAAAAAAAPANDAAAQARGAEAERQRIVEIGALARKYKLPDELERGLVTKGASVADARMAAADYVMQRAQASGGTRPAADFGSSANPDLSERDKARYSMIRAINAALSNDWSKAGFELECSNYVCQQAGRTPQHERSFFVPTNIPWATRATLTVGTPGLGTTGGTLVDTSLLPGAFIEVLRNTARVMQLGATVLSGLIGSVDIPRQTGQSTAYWTTEGTDTTKSEPTFDKVSLALKTVGTYGQITRNMLMQSTPDVDMLFRADLLRVLALGIDLAALSGSGSSGQPMGIANTSGIGSVVGGTNGATVTIDHMIDLETQLMQSNAPEDSLAYLANAKTVGWLKKLKSTTGQYLWTNAPMGGRSATPGELNGYPVARSNQARNTLTKGSASGICSEIFFGAWSELLIGEWGVLEIVPNPYDSAVFKNGGVLLRALQSIDVAVRHAASFATMSDALTA